MCSNTGNSSPDFFVLILFLHISRKTASSSIRSVVLHNKSLIQLLDKAVSSKLNFFCCLPYLNISTKLFPICIDRATKSNGVLLRLSKLNNCRDINTECWWIRLGKLLHSNWIFTRWFISLLSKEKPMVELQQMRRLYKHRDCSWQTLLPAALSLERRWDVCGF